ncbi:MULTISPECIES: hypothetical protein [unclassified Campylobacter]|uniref:hypothetical protein n=1 Tax=unclassified Campylobacter TaxID=2593542 RepID=UPI001237F588|nr:MULTISPECIES: hypothetical protein [unclassified Campylobacter]KAA6224641.1 hypothetical protein FMM54_07250 [Campylobacter sp. LR185c]KAA6225641.1 hypothetical protein FMM57_07045 [Campylobacter sp. LR286c]KAA6225760.1 hypothetical protein FMM55_05710 [Campylobacter sp. LR196d]KAA6229614.1 hypothetical protein FMM58_06800 [Campylobacter sp. LR291e]KAA6230141.1 hypothetical protein FMM56_06990 [Campylobacter sp. LR264d]
MSLYLLISALAFLVLYFGVKKVALIADEQEIASPIKVDIYPKFCDYIDEKIIDLRTKIEKEELKLINEDDKDIFLEKLGDLSRKLTFIQTMNLSKKNDNIWQSELFEFFQNLENLINEFIQNAEELNDNLRQEFANKFEELKKDSKYLSLNSPN